MPNTYGALPHSYVLVIAEKPRAAEKIAKALGKPIKIRINSVPVWIVGFRGDNYVIASAVGHMYTLHTDEPGYPVYSYRWVPRFLVEREAKHVKTFLDVLSRLSKHAKAYINACDYDVEGSVIGYMIIKHLGDESRAFRAKFSSLVQQEIVRAFEHLERLDYEMIEAGVCRHILDWLWGINTSRALMDLYLRVFKTKRILSAGRVQTPTLAHAVEVILQRRLFVPQPRAQPSIYIKLGEALYRLEPLDPPFVSAEDVQRYVDKAKTSPEAYVENIYVKDAAYNPPHPFNLPDLQSEAYRILGFSPYRTQKLAEELYLEALISYPRTNSQKLPPNLDNRGILEKLMLNPLYRPLVEKLIAETKGVLKPNNGPKEDPAHPAIYPTGEKPEKRLSTAHLKLYDLIVRRYLATFAQPMSVQLAEVVFDIHGRRYALRGARILKKGWSLYYPFISISERYIPLDLLRRGMRVPVEKIKIVISYTQPPRSPTRLELLKWMEEVEIGTEATRAEIVETLFRRGYIYSRSRYVDVSDLAIALIYILRDYVKDLVRVELTREFEKMLNDIISRKSSCRVIETKAREAISSYLWKMKENMDQIARDLFKYLEIGGGRVERSCKICKRAVYKEGLCVFHYEALNRVREGYEAWRKFNYSWEKYLEKLTKFRSSGLYVKEVCLYLIKNPSSKD